MCDHGIIVHTVQKLCLKTEVCVYGQKNAGRRLEQAMSEPHPLLESSPVK